MARTFTILVVDDNPNNRFTVRELIGKLPYTEIVEAASGEDALRLTVERRFQLILLDVQMPGMDGYETAGMLQMTARTRDIPIIFLTAVFKAEEFIRHGYSLGAVDYLTKPLDDNILLNRVRHYQNLHEREQKLEDALTDLRAMKANVMQAERLSALGSMVAGVSHELNTPLGNVKMATSTLHDRLQETSKAYRDGKLTRNQIGKYFNDCEGLSELANRGVDRALNLVFKFKQMAEDQITEERCTFDLKILVENAIANIRLSLSDAPWEIKIEVATGIQMNNFPQLIEQIIHNVVTNSIRHGFEGRERGSITIRARCEENQRSGAKQVAMSFIDDGIGIEPDNVTRVFDPFFTTKLGQGGSGIGLNICHRIASTLLDGKISIESALGVGTTVTLTIPCNAPAII